MLRTTLSRFVARESTLLKHSRAFSAAIDDASTPKPSTLQQKAKDAGGYMATGHRDPALDTTRFLITGALGQIGSELVGHLRKQYSPPDVMATDIRTPADGTPLSGGAFSYLDVMNADNFEAVVLQHHTDWVIHLASVLSAIGEQQPQLAMKLNVRCIEHVLESARHNGFSVYAPSSIAAFGPSTPLDHTPDVTIMRPTTIYGVSKIYLELLGEYYHRKYGVNFRSLRYPGVISNKTNPGGGTTDYAVEIYHHALKHGYYKCFLSENTRMPMMYMPDVLRATQMLLEAPESALTQRVYNITSFSFTPAEVAASIRKHIPDFKIEYQPDFRQDIADTWPKALDDSQARKDWGWSHEYDLDSMTEDMLTSLKPKYA